MRTVFKYPLTITDEQIMNMPVGAKPLTVQMQGEWLCLWVEVDTESMMVAYTVRIFGTGHPLPTEPMKYLGTAQQFGGQLVWHVYIML